MTLVLVLSKGINKFRSIYHCGVLDVSNLVQVNRALVMWQQIILYQILQYTINPSHALSTKRMRRASWTRPGRFTGPVERFKDLKQRVV